MLSRVGRTGAMSGRLRRATARHTERNWHVATSVSRVPGRDGTERE